MTHTKTIRTTAALMALALLILFASTTVQAGGKVGLSAALQDQHTDILLPIWVGPSTAIVPSVSLISLGDIGMDFGVSLTLRGYFAEREGLRPYLGGRGGMLYENPDGSDSRTDWVAGALGGGEYFFSDNFSMNVEGQLNITFSDDESYRFGNPGNTNINTAAVIAATVYF